MHNRRCKAPCPGCREVNQYRRKEEVCDSCKKLLEQALALREWETRPDPGIEIIQVPEVTHGFPGFYAGRPRGLPSDSERNDPRSRLQVLMAKLILQVSKPLRSDTWTGRQAILTNESKIGRNLRWEGFRDVRSISKVLVPIIRDLYDAIADALIETNEYARREGQNILLSLASGELSVEGFNETQIKKVR